MLNVVDSRTWKIHKVEKKFGNRKTLIIPHTYEDFPHYFRHTRSCTLVYSTLIFFGMSWPSHKYLSSGKRRIQIIVRWTFFQKNKTEENLQKKKIYICSYPSYCCVNKICVLNDKIIQMPDRNYTRWQKELGEKKKDEKKGRLSISRYYGF